MEKLDELLSAYQNTNGDEKDKVRQKLYDILESYNTEVYPRNSEIVSIKDATKILDTLGHALPPEANAFYISDQYIRARYLNLLQKVGIRDISIETFESHIKEWSMMGLYAAVFSAIPSKSKRTREDSYQTRTYADSFLGNRPRNEKYKFQPSHYVSEKGIMFRGVMLEDVKDLSLVSAKPLFCIGDPWQARYYSYGFTLPEVERRKRKPFMIVIMLSEGTPMLESLDEEWQLPIKNAYLKIREHVPAMNSQDIDIVYADFFPMNESQILMRDEFIHSLIHDQGFIDDHVGRSDKDIMDVALAYFNDYVVSGDAGDMFE